MKLVKFELNGKDVEFVCTSRDTRNGFAHDAVMFVNCGSWSTGKCYYLNRTWESWGYQSACLEAANNSLKYEMSRVTDEFKRENNISRVVGDKRKAALKEKMDSDNYVIFLRNVKEVLRNRSF